jgi:hypothetical protein
MVNNVELYPRGLGAFRLQLHSVSTLMAPSVTETSSGAFSPMSPILVYMQVTDQLEACAWEWCLAHGCRPPSVSDLGRALTVILLNPFLYSTPSKPYTLGSRATLLIVLSYRYTIYPKLVMTLRYQVYLEGSDMTWGWGGGGVEAGRARSHMN